MLGQQTGGTNWEAALSMALGKGYDTVYLITDGEPTAVNGYRQEWIDDAAYYSGLNPPKIPGDPGNLPHVRDVNRAISVANKLKQENTRVEGIGINFPEGNVEVLHDNQRRWKGYGYSWDFGWYYAPEAIYRSVSAEKLLSYVSGQVGNKALDSASDVDADWYAIDSFADLTETLKARVLSGWGGKLFIKKWIRQPKASSTGNATEWEYVDGGGWTFTANATSGGLKNTSDQLARMTDEFGFALWDFDLKDPEQEIKPEDPPAAVVDVAEVEQDGYSLEPQPSKRWEFKDGEWKVVEGKSRATCTSGGEERPILSEDPNNDTGFAVSVDINAPTICQVVNRQDPLTGFALQKVGYESGKQVAESLSDAEFALFETNPDGGLGREVEQNLTWDQTNSKYVVEGLKSGEYFLVETRSASGFELLPKPIRLHIHQNLVGTDTFETKITIPEDENAVPAAASVVDGEAVITLVNYKVGILPRTGGPGLVGYLLSAMLLIGAALGLRRKLV